jgi:hypothetical protein
MSSKGHLIKEVMEAVTFLRENNTIPSETIEFMKQVSLKAVEDLRVLTTNKRLQIDLHKKFGGEHLGTRYIKYPIAGVGVAARDKSSEFNNVIEDVAKIGRAHV